MVAALEFAVVVVVVVVATVVAGQQIAAAVAVGLVAGLVSAELVVVVAEPFGQLHLPGDLCSLAAPADKPFPVEAVAAERAVAVAG